jgi:hypothetical protein
MWDLILELKQALVRRIMDLKNCLLLIRDDFKMVIEDSRVGFHGGIALQLRIKKFIIQPEVLVNTINVNYKLTGRISGLIDTILAKETIRNVDIPLMIGFKSGVLRLNAGPVGHLYLDSSSDLLKFPVIVSNLIRCMGLASRNGS